MASCAPASAPSIIENMITPLAPTPVPAPTSERPKYGPGELVDYTAQNGDTLPALAAPTGTHLHFARKYNGEWVIADGPLPFVLSGWTVYAGEKPYQGKLVKGDKVITADLYAQSLAVILRENDE